MIFWIFIYFYFLYIIYFFCWFRDSLILQIKIIYQWWNSLKLVWHITILCSSHESITRFLSLLDPDGLPIYETPLWKIIFHNELWVYINNINILPILHDQYYREKGKIHLIPKIRQNLTKVTHIFQHLSKYLVQR